jgi:hypothetical protein
LFRRKKNAVIAPAIGGRDEWAKAHFLFALKNACFKRQMKQK